LEDVTIAETLFRKFCMDFITLYGNYTYVELIKLFCLGERYYVANVHMLLHFSDSVQNLGPLWAHSTFPFEDANGWLGELYHGTRNPDKQVKCIAF
jgi:hypothetical protein